MPDGTELYHSMACEAPICRVSGWQASLVAVASLMLGISSLILEFRLPYEDVTSAFVAWFLGFMCLIYGPLFVYAIWIGEKSLTAKEMEIACIKTLTREKALLLQYSDVVVRYIIPVGMIGAASFVLAILYLATFLWADTIEGAMISAPLWWILWAFNSYLVFNAALFNLCIKAFWQIHCLLCMHYDRFLNFVNKSDTVCWDGLRASLHRAQDSTSRLLSHRGAGAAVLLIIFGGGVFMAFGFVLLLIEPSHNILFAFGACLFFPGFANFFMPLFGLADITSRTKRVCEAAEEFECRVIEQIGSPAPLDSYRGLQMERMKPEEKVALARFMQYASSKRVGLVLVGVRIEKELVWTLGLRVLLSVGTLVPVVQRIFHSETATSQSI